MLKVCITSASFKYDIHFLTGLVICSILFLQILSKKYIYYVIHKIVSEPRDDNDFKTVCLLHFISNPGTYHIIISCPFENV